MNVAELKKKWADRLLNVGDQFTLEGAVIKYHQQFEGESSFGKWSFDAVDFGDSSGQMRVSFKDLHDHSHLLTSIIGQPRSFTAKVDKNKKDPSQLSVLIENCLEQLQGPMASPEVQVNADVSGPEWQHEKSTGVAPPPPGWDEPTEPAPTATPPGGAKDLCQLGMDLMAHNFDLMSKDPRYANVDPNVLADKAGAIGNTVFIQLAREGKLNEAAKEFDVPF